MPAFHIESTLAQSEVNFPRFVLCNKQCEFFRSLEALEVILIFPGGAC